MKEIRAGTPGARSLDAGGEGEGSLNGASVMKGGDGEEVGCTEGEGERRRKTHSEI